MKKINSFVILIVMHYINITLFYRCELYNFISKCHESTSKQISYLKGQIINLSSRLNIIEKKIKKNLSNFDSDGNMHFENEQKK